MARSKPDIKRISTEACGPELDGITETVRRGAERVITEKDGKPVAAVISAHDLERLEFYERKREEQFAVLEQIGEAFEDVPPEEIEREVEKALAEVRAEMREEAPLRKQSRSQSA